MRARRYETTRRLLLGAAGLAACWIQPGVADADGILLLSDDRRISNSGSGASETPPVAFQSWNASIAQASQQSSVGTARMTGSGFANAFSDLENSEGHSGFDVSFEATERIDVTLNGAFDFQDEAFGSLLGVAKLEQGFTTVFGGNFFPLGPEPFFFEERLEPGVYRLLVALFPNGNGNAFFDFTFDVTIVPEPGTAGLLALGLALLAVARRGR